jgi:hypothetical protein
VSASVIQERQRERLQVEPEVPFGVVRVESVALDAVLAESALHRLNWLSLTLENGAPQVANRGSAANVRRSARDRFGSGHRSISHHSVYQTTCFVVRNF